MLNHSRALGIVAGSLLLGQPVLAAELSFCPLPGARIASSVESLLERRWKHVARQSLDVSCGSAALATLLQFQFGDQVTEQQLIQSILKQVAQSEVSRRGGFTLLDLKRVATDLGYTVHGYKLDFKHLVGLNTPTLVPVNIRGFKHFVVFRGLVGDRVVLADPSFGNLVVQDFDFKSIWQDIALVLEQNDKHGSMPAALSIHEDQLRAAEPQEAIRSFLQPHEIRFEANPDEF